MQIVGAWQNMVTDLDFAVYLCRTSMSILKTWIWLRPWEVDMLHPVFKCFELVLPVGKSAPPDQCKWGCSQEVQRVVQYCWDMSSGVSCHGLGMINPEVDVATSGMGISPSIALWTQWYGWTPQHLRYRWCWMNRSDSWVRPKKGAHTRKIIQLSFSNWKYNFGVSQPSLWHTHVLRTIIIKIVHIPVQYIKHIIFI